MKVYVIDMGRAFYYLQWNCPLTGKRITRSSRCKTRRDAERKAIEVEEKLSVGTGASKVSWQYFLDRYQCEHLRSLAWRSDMKASGILSNFEQMMRPGAMPGITAAMMSEYAAKMRANGKSEATIASHLRTIKAAFQWAAKNRMMDAVPKMPTINRAAGKRVARGRPITQKEFIAMIRASRQTVQDWRPFVKLMRGIWYSGMRIGESVALHWEPGRWPYVDMEKRCLVFPASAHKSNRDDVVPMTDEFRAYVSRFRADAGCVLAPGCHVDTASKVIAEIGAKAGIVVDPSTGRTATAHDLRRAFAQRWSSRLSPIDLQRLMRHSDFATTKNYYIDNDIEGLAGRMRGSP